MRKGSEGQHNKQEGTNQNVCGAVIVIWGEINDVGIYRKNYGFMVIVSRRSRIIYWE